MDDQAAAVAAAMNDIAQVLAERGDSLDLAHRLVHHCQGLLSASAAGLLVVDSSGDLRLLAATSSEAGMVELLQLQKDEGPCLDAYSTGAPVTAPDAREMGHRWPSFAPRAHEQGVLSVHAAPVRTVGQTIGALTLLRDHEGSFARAELDVVHAMASLVAVGLTQLEAVAAAERVRGQLQGALDSRVVVEQAKGALAERHRMHPDDAFRVLRTQARSQRRSLREVAGTVVAELAPRRTGPWEAPAGQH